MSDVIRRTREVLLQAANSVLNTTNTGEMRQQLTALMTIQLSELRLSLTEQLDLRAVVDRTSDPTRLEVFVEADGLRVAFGDGEVHLVDRRDRIVKSIPVRREVGNAHGA